MTWLGVFRDLLTPTHFTDWYVSTAAQGTHVAFGFLGFGLLALVLHKWWGVWKDAPHRTMVLAMAFCSSWELLSWIVYGAYVPEHIVNSLFMSNGAALGYFGWQRAWKLFGAACVGVVAALAVNAGVRL